MRTPGLILVSTLLLGAAAPALAWDPDSHEAIVRTALVLSPAAEGRLTTEFRDALFEELRNADLMDRICRYHRGPQPSKDVAAEAARAFAELRGAATQRPYVRARALGRYLHYVADLAVPTAIAQGRVYQVKDYWSNIDFVVYRERRTLDPAGLAAALRAAGNDAQWADDQPNAWPATFRLAVNLTIDALLLLPPRPDAAAAPDQGPVVFVVNRQDTGRAGNRNEIWAFGDSEYLFVAVVRVGEMGPIKRDMMRRRGVQVAEAATRVGENGTSVRAVLFNNSKDPACNILLQAGKWSLKAGDLSSGDLLPLRFELPKGDDLSRVKVTWTTSTCSSPAVGGALATNARIVLGATGAPPRFDRGAEVVNMEEKRPLGEKPGLAEVVPVKAPPSKVFRDAPTVLTVDLDPAVDGELRRALDLRSFRMRLDGRDWHFQLSGRNLGDHRLGVVEMQVSVAYEQPGKAPGELTLRFDGSRLEPSQWGDLNATVAALGDRPASVRATQMKRIAPAGVSKVPAVTNRLPQP